MATTRTGTYVDPTVTPERPTQSRRPFVWIFRRFDFWLTPTGKMLTFCCFVAGAVGSANVQVPVYHIAFAFSGLWGAAAFVSLIRRVRVNAQWHVPNRGTAGTPLTVSADVVNEGRAVALQLEAGLSASHPVLSVSPAEKAITLEPGEGAHMTFTVTPKRRGIYGPTNVRVWTTFPFNVFRSILAEKRWPTFIVYPAFTPLDELDIPMGLRFQPGGIALTSGTGESPEYIGNREYRSGDPIRCIDFRAWARLAKPAVREYNEEYFCRVALLLDTHIAPREKETPTGHPALEAALSICAAVSDALARGEYILDLFAAGPELYVFRSGRSLAHFENVLEVLAGIDPHRHDPMAEIRPALMDQLNQVTTLIAIVLDWDEARAKLVHEAREHGCAVKIVLIRDGEPTLPFSNDMDDVIVLTPGDVFSGGVDSL